MTTSENYLTWQKVEAGRYVTPDARYAVEVDGYAPSQSAGADTNYNPHGPNLGGHYEGFVGGEWAAVLDPNGSNQNLDWFPTMREARAHCEEHARRTLTPVVVMKDGVEVSRTLVKKADPRVDTDPGQQFDRTYTQPRWV